MKQKMLKIFIICVAIAICGITFFIKGDKMHIGIKMENMDITSVAGDDFYDYATRGWREANPIPNDYVRYGTFDILRNTNLERVRDIAEHNRGKIGKLYKIAMNEKKIKFRWHQSC